MDLAEFIEEKYLEKKSILVMAQAFEKNGSIQLCRLFKPFNINLKQWKKEKIPTRYSYSTQPLPTKFYQLIHSAQFKALCSFITNKEISKITAKLCSFEHSDYTLLYDDLKQEGIYFEIELTEHWKESWGGYTSFSGSKEEFRIIPQRQSFVLINHDNVKHFVKYVNHKAQGKRIVVQGWLK
jgi:Rps23 Pro-64 3,4-dihydroxylase Tpa1-like proline 4-hydroxylase